MEPDGERKQHSQDDKSSRRKIKTPTQLETLEKVFAEEQYPSETVRAELSAQIGLSDRQLQVWFCHRRLKDRKVKEDESPVSVKKQKQEKVGANETSVAVLASEHTDSTLPGGNHYANDCTTTSNRFAQEDAANQSRKQAGKRGRKENENVLGKKFQQVISRDVDLRRAAELRAISAVEAQLGELLREDCPILGVEFDGLPSGAFGAFMAPLQSYEAVQTSLQCDNKASEQHEMKARKNIRNDQYASNESGHRKATLSSSFDFDDQQCPRTVQEYKFIPEQPTRRPELNRSRDKSTQSKFYLGADSPFQSLPSTGSFLHGSDALMTAFSFQGGVGTVGGGMLPQLDGCANFLFPQSGMKFEGMHQDAFPGFGYDSQFAPHRSSLQLLSREGSYLGSEKLTLLHEQEQAKFEKKRKNEEAKIAKEVEAHEKRIRREIERQDIARRKREEQIRKELEKQDREKRREEERVIRDRQREEERIQREHRREIERREKIIEKETRRVEQQQRKDESRRQKEFAKLKVSSERAIARRLARDTTDLIDDERLELLEAAAMAQGLPSIYMLDGSTLNELDRYTEFLKKFPPASVRMKKPLSVHPWIDSRVIVGNLLMVWRFLNTFADVLGLWPFTVDELVQAFHDYDPRLLGEIHMALLKILVKDIEDVAQASSAGLAANQYVLGLSGGGHPLLVEAAFAWGFDIREWRQHLNPLTWPEVLRQFALSAGYGPKWKKHGIEVDRPRDDDQGNEAEDVVNTLRSGVAVENAVSQMRGKGGQGKRRRHRLTPGTVKFAAFHVLSVEGDNGLTILEVAERIQKSGLRDLSTSKTPEASIAAALSRDARLFERVAPSTYCVRSPFRKDPEDAEHILQVARDKVRLFQNVTPDAEDREKETEFVDEAEREEDTDEDVEDIEGDEADEILAEGQKNLCVSNVEELKSGVCIGIDKGQQTGDMDISHQSIVSDDIHLVRESITDVQLETIDVNDFEHPGEGAAILKDEHLLGGFPEETEIDESSEGEPWVQGLMEGDYCDLSVEERLNALVALVDVVNEGNTFRGALEERLEAANSLKRQMWAEAQLDRRRLKEEQLMKMQNLDEGRHESPVGETEKCAEATDLKVELILDGICTQADPGIELGGVDKTIYRQVGTQEGSLVPQPGSVTDKSRSQLKADIGRRAEELYIYRCLPLGFDRKHNRYWQFLTCNNGQDPGCGRIYFESSVDAQWHVIDMEESFDALMVSLDTRGTREANLHGVLQKYESFLRDGMRKAHARKCRVSVAEMKANAGQFPVECSRNDEFTHNSGYASEEGSSAGGVVAPSGDLSGDAGAIFVECNTNQVERESALERYLEFDRWLWKKCMKGDFCLNASKFGRKRCPDVLSSCEICHDFYFPREKHCSHCHTTIEGPGKLEVKFAQHLLECNERRRKRESNWRFQMPPKSLPSRIQLLKAEILTVEVHIPLEALKSTWTDARRKAWASMVKHASSSGELLQLATELEAVVHRDWLSPSYETTDELLRTASEGSSLAQGSPVVGESSVLPWVPQTTAAVALRLTVLDAALSYSLDQKQQRLKHMDSKDSMKTMAVQANDEPATTKAQEVRDEDESSSEEGNDDGSIDVCKQPCQKRGRGGRLRGRGRGRGSSSRSVAVSDVTKGSKGKVKSSDLPAVDEQQVEKVAKGRRGRGGLGRGSGRGRGGGHGRGGGRGRGRGRGSGRGTRSTAQGCVPSSGSGSSRQLPVVRRQQKRAKTSTSARQKKNASRQVAEEEQEQSEDDSAQNGNWEAQNFVSENEEDKHYNEYEEENAICSSEENAPDCSEEQDEDELDQEEEHMSDDYSDDEKRQSEADDFGKQEEAEDSVDEEQGEAVLTEGEEDEEEGEKDGGDSQSDTSQESESG